MGFLGAGKDRAPTGRVERASQARLSAALMRIVYWVLGDGFPNDMLLYADDLEVLTMGREGRIGGVLAFALMAALGAPFKWARIGLPPTTETFPWDFELERHLGSSAGLLSEGKKGGRMP